MEPASKYTSLILLVSALVTIVLLIQRVAKRRAESRAADGEEQAEAHALQPQARPPAESVVGSDIPGASPPADRLARIRAAHGEPTAPRVLSKPVRTAPPVGSSPPAPPALRSERVTAVLRRQVPVRDEPPRSWLGGLPMMPDAVEWPRGVNEQYPERGEIPLHFLAQIACEDLPAEMWVGLGPRTGWLLFFINPNHFSGEGKGLHRVIYTRKLGSERRPPFDCGPVHDKVHTGGSYNWLDKDDIPAFWRRWPIDIVPMPNALTLHEENGSTWKSASPDNLSEVLYADVPHSKTEFASPMPRIRPLTFGQAQTAVESLAKSLRFKVRSPIDDKARELLLADGGHQHLIAELGAGLERLREIAPDDRGEGQARRLAFLEAAVPEYRSMDAAKLLESIETRHAQWLAWREKLAEGCDQITAMLGKSDADAPLQEDYWQQLTATFEGKHFDHLELRHSRIRAGDFPVSLMSPRETIELKPPQGMDQIAIEYYLDPARRHLLPADWAAAQEPAWRALYNNRPHRMGGYHDGVQSEPIEDPAFGQMLLMQIATDDAMDWCWGDGGVYFFWIRPEHLEACDFSGVEVWLECH
ncbi:DUF1963 domain-containing protein [Porphyrobacter sp. YT40]|uniref:DUF1963 domain-containing protein n=1 Tax=Porphyrobacter sp. YT40 TaxID=2547601 RepID=UPI001142F6E9|nr:DUF1963 domain-containing protein [Porphyrobacter sp. YT40]QDH33908.1 DUF1963 domain-containing protein [Porphyrobacter sp. YT40]